MDPMMFGHFAFNRGSGTLTREGKHIPLGSRSSALLKALLDANGSVVSKGDLMERVWPGSTVEEGNLTLQVAALRKALGQRADNSDWIVTVARIGYRLWHEDAKAPRVPSSPLPSLAVLPFHISAASTLRIISPTGLLTTSSPPSAGSKPSP
jgi:DNA-binding winged helix-turn-helix (wHTH) protein